MSISAIKQLARVLMFLLTFNPDWLNTRNKPEHTTYYQSPGTNRNCLPTGANFSSKFALTSCIICKKLCFDLILFKLMSHYFFNFAFNYIVAFRAIFFLLLGYSTSTNNSIKPSPPDLHLSYPSFLAFDLCDMIHLFHFPLFFRSSSSWVSVVLLQYLPAGSRNPQSWRSFLYLSSTYREEILLRCR